ncbi:MAG: SNF2 helicase associated domain-containing protein [Eubacteriales bacterium]|nr:SNF2 helicase associated domain-containing protein [Eubacteriales bacterium]MDD3200202.1 SNF2 helicase associated domain-containing protein [Eubacteriales bacterium]
MHLSTKLSQINIRAESGNSANFARGQQYFRKHRVTDVKLWKLASGEKLEAHVKGENGSWYTTTADIENTGEIGVCNCTCPAYETQRYICKHIVALLNYRYYNTDSHSYTMMNVEPSYGNTSYGGSSYGDAATKNGGIINRTIAQYDYKKSARNTAVVSTDSRIRSIIDRYVVDDVARSVADENVKAVPKLEIYNGTVFLNITVGRTRQYVVRNIESFCNDIKTRSRVAYGKELDLVHHIDAFEQTSQPLIKFIMRKQDEKNQYFRSNDIYSYRYNEYYSSTYGPERDKRNLKLTPSGFDELFEILTGSIADINTFGTYGSPATKHTATKISDRSPEFFLEIKELDNKKGFVLHLPDCEYILGAKNIYLLCRDNSEFGKENGLTDTLCQCSREVSKKIKDLVTAKLESRQPLLISNADMISFYTNVLEELKDVIDIRGDLDRLRNYAPDEMQANIYLDSPQYDAITAVTKYQYGEVEIDPDDDSIIAPKNIARDEKKERRITVAMCKYFKHYDQIRKFLFIQGDDDLIYQFVTEGFEEIAKLGQIFASDKFKNMGVKRPPQISVGVRLESDLLNIDLDTKELPLDEAMDALNQYKQKRKYYRMKDGSFLKLNDAGFSELADMIDGLGLSQKDISKGQITVPKYRAMYLDNILKNSDNVTFERNAHFKSLIRNMKAIDDSDFAVPESLNHIMRGYQKDGFRWLATMDSYGFGGILADDMGLGKTLEVISLLLSKKEEGQNCATLVVCPASLVLNWQNEIQKFAPELNVLCVMGSLAERKTLLKQMDDYDVIITSYDLLKRDIERYRSKEFRYQIIDEAQYIKNQGTQNAKAVKAIKSVQRFALTGTPVENRLSELWSIFDFLMPSYLYNYKKFKDIYETDIVKNGDKEKTQKLSRQVAPFMLRRLKANVLKELPEKVESVVYSKMEGEQKKLYLANLARTRSEIDKNIQEKGFESSKIAILALLTRLRQLCCHPSLFYEDYREGSAKLETCIELLLEAASGGHKVLLFSQFTSMLDIIERRLKEEGITYYMLTGATSKEKRLEMVDRFNVNNIQVFLISLKAGGTGLNMTGADVVIHYDPWWNIAAQNQATDRTHRIGQKNSVQVYKLIEKGSIEEKILKLQESKKDLADAIVKDDMTGIGALSQESLLALLQP